MKTVLALSYLFFTPFAFAAVVGKKMEDEADGVRMKGWRAHDDTLKGKRPGVLVVHEGWGLNDYVKKPAAMLAGAGYAASYCLPLKYDAHADLSSWAHTLDFLKAVF